MDELGSEVFIRAAQSLVADRLRRPQLISAWSSGLTLRIYEDRGPQGVRIVVTGDLMGTCEWWVEPCRDGAIVHFWLRPQLDPEPSLNRWVTSRRRRQVRARLADYGRRWRRVLFVLKDELEER